MTEDHMAAAKARMKPEVSAALDAANQIEEKPIRAWPPDWQDHEEISYFYKSGSILTRDVDAQRVAEALNSLPSPFDRDRPSPVVDSVLKGVTRFQLSDLPKLAPAEDQTPGIVGALLDKLGPGSVNHEHAFEVTYVHCPATEPERVVPSGAPDLEAALWPPRSPGDAGRGVHVSVVDTGLLNGVAGWAPWLAGVTAHSLPADVDDPDTYNVATRAPGADGYADPYAGHGSFIAGVIRCVAPGADVVVERMLGPSGFVAEGDMISQIRQGLSRSPDIISLSAGGHTRDDTPPLGLQQLWEQRLNPQGGVVLVAAAGNNSTSRPFWPAAFDWCVGVGSMTRDGQARSWFSNWGSWVDVYAPGQDIVNAYPRMEYKTFGDGTDRAGEIRDTSAGIVKWSGTSFATPIVAALIAARMSRTGQNGRTAAQAVLAAARGQFRPGIGPRLFP